MINSQSTNHHTSQRLSCFVSRYDAFSLSNVKNISRRKTYLWDKRNVPCKNKALFLFPRKNTIRNIYEIFGSSKKCKYNMILFLFSNLLLIRREKNVASRKIIMEALFLFNVCEMVVQSFVNYLSDISSRHFSFLKVIIFSWKRRSQIILASFDI